MKAGGISIVTEPPRSPTTVPMVNQDNVDNSSDPPPIIADPPSTGDPIIKRHKARKMIMTIPSKKQRLQTTEDRNPDKRSSDPSAISEPPASAASHLSMPNTSNYNERTSPHLPPKCNVCGDEVLAELRRNLRRVESKVDSIYELLRRTTLCADYGVTSPMTPSGSSPVGGRFPGSNVVDQSSPAPQITATTTSIPQIAIAAAGITVSIRRDGDENIDDTTSIGDTAAITSAVEVKEEPQEEDDDGKPASSFVEVGHASNGDAPLSHCGLESSILKPVARATLLFSGWAVTVEHLMEYGPTWINRVSEDEVQKVIDHLVRENLLKELGRHDVRWPTSTSETTRNMVIYSKLMLAIGDHSVEKYGLTTRAYLDALRYKVTQCTAHLNEICDMVSGTIGRSKTTRLLC